MQGDSGPSRSPNKKRKNVNDSSSSNAVVRGKRARKSKSPSEQGETGKTKPEWPDYFKEVSVREDNSKLISGTLSLSVIQGAFMVDALMAKSLFPNSIPRCIDIQGLLHISMLCPRANPCPGIEHGASFLHFEKAVCYLVRLPPCFH
jgi:hypothetical protein